MSGKRKWTAWQERAPSGPWMVEFEDRSSVEVGGREAKERATLCAAAPALYETLKAMTEFWIYALDKPKGAKPNADDHKRAAELGTIAATALSLAEGKTP